jgi:hypothetical protein
MRVATFNARAETVEAKPFFRDVFKGNPCLISVSGYYEWQTTPEGKQPWYFTAADGSLLTAAGLWDQWKDRSKGEVLKSCTMIITEPNDFVAEVHDRMPVPHARLVDRRPIRAVAEPGNGKGSAEAGAERLPATLAGLEARQQLEG